MKNLTIQTAGLSRRFGSLQAVDRLDLQVPQGSIYGFLGPNGAGKTTTIRMLLGLIRPDAGKVGIFGQDLGRQRQQILRRVGSMVESPSLYPHLNGRENLEIFRRLKDTERVQIDRVLTIVNLQKDAHRLVRQYSMGMRQRLGLAIALLGNPDLLVLDEPTNGLDPAGIHEIRSLLCSLPAQEGITVFLSSHLLSEVEQMATRIGILLNGKLIFQGSPDELRTRYQDVLNVQTGELESAQVFLQGLGWPVVRLNQHLNVSVNGASDVAAINRQLVQAGHQVLHLSLAQPSLEDIFLTLTSAQASGEVMQ